VYADAHRKGDGGMPRQKKEKDDKYIRQNICIEPEQYKKLLEYCQREERSISWVIRKALDNYISV
jgi:hypothetical protein